LNEQVMTVDPLGNTTFTVLGPTGEDLADINAIGAVSRTIYNANEEPVTTIDALGNTSEVQYNADGEVTVSTDGRGYSTVYVYTGAGQEAAGEIGVSSFFAAGRPGLLPLRRRRFRQLVRDWAGRQRIHRCLAPLHRRADELRLRPHRR